MWKGALDAFGCCVTLSEFNMEHMHGLGFRGSPSPSLRICGCGVGWGRCSGSSTGGGLGALRWIRVHESALCFAAVQSWLMPRPVALEKLPHACNSTRCSASPMHPCACTHATLCVACVYNAHAGVNASMPCHDARACTLMRKSLSICSLPPTCATRASASPLVDQASRCVCVCVRARARACVRTWVRSCGRVVVSTHN